MSYLINELLKIEKIIIVLNKCDLRSVEDNNKIQENIKSITSSENRNISVVQTIATQKIYLIKI